MSTLDLYKKYYGQLSKLANDGVKCYGKIFFSDISKKIQFEKVRAQVYYYEEQLKLEGYSII